MQSGEILQNGHIIAGRYEIRSLLGSGGMANVYRAWDLKLCREIALKTIRIDRMGEERRSEVLRARLMREAQAAAQLNHPGIVVIHDLGETAGFPYISMEYIRGVHLRKWMQQKPPPDLGKMLRIASGIAQALDYAHSREIVHRDIKPENIMIADDLTPKITDFGIARIQSADQITLTTDGKIVCTYHYTAPEYFKGFKGDYKGDIFSFGCVIYEMLTGRFAFTGDTEPQVWWKIMNVDPEIPSEVNSRLPKAVDDIVMSMLNKTPENRPASCSQAITRIFETLRDSPQAEPVYSPPPATVKADLRNLNQTMTEGDLPEWKHETTKALPSAIRKRNIRLMAIGLAIGATGSIGLWIMNDRTGKDSRPSAVNVAPVEDPASPTEKPTFTPVAKQELMVDDLETAALIDPLLTMRPIHPPTQTQLERPVSPSTSALQMQATVRPAMTALLPKPTSTPPTRPIVLPTERPTAAPDAALVEYFELKPTNTALPPPAIEEIRILHTPLAVIESGKDLVLRVEAIPAEEVFIVEAVLEKGKSGGRKRYSFRPDGSAFSLTVPASELPKKAVKYQIEVTGKSGMRSQTREYSVEIRDIWAPF